MTIWSVTSTLAIIGGRVTFCTRRLGLDASWSVSTSTWAAFLLTVTGRSQMWMRIVGWFLSLIPDS